MRNTVVITTYKVTILLFIFYPEAKTSLHTSISSPSNLTALSSSISPALIPSSSSLYFLYFLHLSSYYYRNPLGISLSHSPHFKLLPFFPSIFIIGLLAYTHKTRGQQGTTLLRLCQINPLPVARHDCCVCFVDVQ